MATSHQFWNIDFTGILTDTNINVTTTRHRQEARSERHQTQNPVKLYQSAQQDKIESGVKFCTCTFN